MRKKAESFTGKEILSESESSKILKKRAKSSSSFLSNKTNTVKLSDRRSRKSSSFIEEDTAAIIDSFSKFVYIFVARDSDMFVLENHIEPKIASAKFTAEIYEVLNFY